MSSIPFGMKKSGTAEAALSSLFLLGDERAFLINNSSFPPQLASSVLRRRYRLAEV